MTKLLLISDNHGNMEVVENILKKENYDISIHLGDSQLSESFIKKHFTYYVQGNHDSYLPEKDIFEIEENRIIIGHGHYFLGFFNIFNAAKGAVSFAKKHNANIVIFGHSHYPCNKIIDNILCVNPGSCYLPRNPEGRSYAIMKIDHQNVDVEIKYF